MCTVSYLPNSNQSFYLTSNRDELTDRQSDSPKIYSYKDKQIVFPKDKRVFGSWIAFSKTRAICLLNGGFESHNRKNEYRMSRGIVVLDALVQNEIIDFEYNYDLSDIEPFTMVWVDLNPVQLFELVWDGANLHKKQLDVNKAHFWSSSTLYNSDWRAKRKQWFTKWIQNNEIDADAIRNFHLNGGEKDEANGFIMSRNKGELKTISVTQVLKKEELIMRHVDLIENKTYDILF
jgi:uncharacterized protein with NRDE domain